MHTNITLSKIRSPVPSAKPQNKDNFTVDKSMQSPELLLAPPNPKCILKRKGRRGEDQEAGKDLKCKMPARYLALAAAAEEGGAAVCWLWLRVGGLQSAEAHSAFK